MNRIKYLVSIGLAWLFITASPLVASGDERDTPSPSAGTATESSAPTQAYCGISVSPLDPVLSAQLPEVTEKGRGVVVSKVMKSSPAEQAGIKQYDILLTYSDQSIYSPEQLVKLVRHDQPGREVELTYVRGGKTGKATLKLGKVPATSEVRDRSAQASREDVVRNEQSNKERSRQNDPRPWALFESMTITKLADGRYKADIDYRDKDKKILHREYSGTREEIRKAMEKDSELPADAREHLLRTLDQQSPRVFPLVPGALRDLFDLDRELFNWPNLNF